MTYAVARTWSTDLEPGTWHEIVYADRPRIIAGFVFVPPRDKADFRGPDGKAEKDDQKLAGFIEAMQKDTGYCRCCIWHGTGRCACHGQ